MANTPARILSAVRNLQKGKDIEESFRMIYESYYRSVVSFFMDRGHSQEESRELAQDTFVGVFDAIKRFKWKSKFETWLYTIAGHIRANELRRKAAQKRSAIEASLDQQEETGNPDRMVLGDTAIAAEALDRVITAEQVEHLRNALKKLPHRMFCCIVLSLYQDKSNEEIAKILNISDTTVRSQLHQARKKLRRLLGRTFDGLDL
jgi:RNA polymerase sigma-70 factor (ECF subfamily)